MSICRNCIYYEAPTEEDNRESCKIACDEVAFQMGVPSCAFTVLIDSKQIKRCNNFAENKNNE